MGNKGGFRVRTNRLLISSAMLTAMCEEKSTDNLKLLEKLAMICIAEISKVGEPISVVDVLSQMENRFAFRNMPKAVIEKILQRIARKSNSACLNYDSKRNEYTLIKNLDTLLEEYTEREKNASRDTDVVVTALVAWLNEKKPVLGADREKAEVWLADFLETRGVDVLFDTDELLDETATNSEFVNYQISVTTTLTVESA